MDDALPLQELGGNYSEPARFSSQKCARLTSVAIADLFGGGGAQLLFDFSRSCKRRLDMRPPSGSGRSRGGFNHTTEAGGWIKIHVLQPTHPIPVFCYPQSSVLHFISP